MWNAKTINLRVNISTFNNAGSTGSYTWRHQVTPRITWINQLPHVIKQAPGLLICIKLQKICTKCVQNNVKFSWKSGKAIKCTAVFCQVTSNSAKSLCYLVHSPQSQGKKQHITPFLFPHHIIYYRFKYHKYKSSISPTLFHCQRQIMELSELPTL